MTATTTDPLAACEHLHGAFGPGCPYCWQPPTDRAAARTPIAADRCATTTKDAS